MGLDAGSLARYLGREHATMAALWPSGCTIGGIVCQCAETAEDVEAVFEDRGRVVYSRVVLRISKKALATEPDIGALVTMDDGRVLRVASVGGEFHDQAWTLHCEDEGK